jgi:hypothetical protein
MPFRARRYAHLEYKLAGVIGAVTSSKPVSPSSFILDLAFGGPWTPEPDHGDLGDISQCRARRSHVVVKGRVRLIAIP